MTIGLGMTNQNRMRLARFNFLNLLLFFRQIEFHVIIFIFFFLNFRLDCMDPKIESHISIQIGAMAQLVLEEQECSTMDDFIGN